MSPLASPWVRRLAWLTSSCSLLVLVSLGLAFRADLPLSALRARYAPAPSRFLQLEGMNVHYRDEGQGHPIVLLHGVASSLHTWDGWSDRLKTHRRVVRLDLPGSGLTGPAPDRDYSAKRVARVVAKLLDKLGIEQADLAGNAQGGRVALVFALSFPRRTRRLILIDTVALSGQPEPPILAFARSPFGPWLGRWFTPRFLLRRNLAQAYGDAARAEARGSARELDIDGARLARYEAMILHAGNRQALLDLPREPGLDARLKALHVPTLVQWGAQDRYLPVASAQRLQSFIARAELIVYPQAAHVPMEEIPYLTVRDADAFLESTDSEPSLLDEPDDGEEVLD